MKHINRNRSRMSIQTALQFIFTSTKLFRIINWNENVNRLLVIDFFGFSFASGSSFFFFISLLNDCMQNFLLKCVQSHRNSKKSIFYRKESEQERNSSYKRGKTFKGTWNFEFKTFWKKLTIFGSELKVENNNEMVEHSPNARESSWTKPLHALMLQCERHLSIPSAVAIEQFKMLRCNCCSCRVLLLFGFVRLQSFFFSSVAHVQGNVVLLLFYGWMCFKNTHITTVSSLDTICAWTMLRVWNSERCTAHIFEINLFVLFALLEIFFSLSLIEPNAPIQRYTHTHTYNADV